MSLERMSPADLEALFIHATRELKKVNDDEREEQLYRGLNKIKAAQAVQFHRIIVEGKPPANRNTILNDLDIEVDYKAKTMTTTHPDGRTETVQFAGCGPNVNQPSTNPEPNDK